MQQVFVPLFLMFLFLNRLANIWSVLLFCDVLDSDLGQIIYWHHKKPQKMGLNCFLFSFQKLPCQEQHYKCNLQCCCLIRLISIVQNKYQDLKSFDAFCLTIVVSLGLVLKNLIPFDPVLVINLIMFDQNGIYFFPRNILMIVDFSSFSEQVKLNDILGWFIWTKLETESTYFLHAKPIVEKNVLSYRVSNIRHPLGV